MSVGEHFGESARASEQVSLHPGHLLTVSAIGYLVEFNF